MLALLHLEDDLTSYNLTDLVHLLDQTVEDVVTEFNSFEAPISLLLPYETHRAAVDALLASLRLRNQLKYFSAGFPRASTSRRRSTIQNASTSIHYNTTSSPSIQPLSCFCQARTPPLHSSSSLNAQSSSNQTSSHEHITIQSTVANVTNVVTVSASNLHKEEGESSSQGRFVLNSTPLDKTVTSAFNSNSSNNRSSPSGENEEFLNPIKTNDAIGLRHHHYYHFDDTLEEMPLEVTSNSMLVPTTHFDLIGNSINNHNSVRYYFERPIDYFSSTTVTTNNLPQFYKSLLEREDRERAARTELITQRERRILSLSLCIPFFSLRERYGKIAKLSTGCHRLVMAETPVTEVDFCNTESEGLLLLPAFSQRIAPQLGRTLRYLRVHCVEHCALSSLIGAPLEQLVLVHVPTTGGSSLLPSRLPPMREAAQRQVAEFLSPLSPLSSWLFVAGKRCRNLKFLSLRFNPSLPFSVLSGSSAASTTQSLSSSSPPNYMLTSLIARYGPYSGDLEFPQVSPTSVYFFKRLITSADSPSDSLVFPSLEVLQFIGAASVMPLALLLCARFPRLEVLNISTTSAFFTGNLAEFLCLFTSRCLASSHRIKSLTIHHGSNIANVALLESIKLFHSLSWVRLTSSNSFGCGVLLSHPTLTTLELTFHLGLTWDLDTPSLQRLVFVLPTEEYNQHLIITTVKEFLFDQIDRSPSLSQFALEGPNVTTIMELIDRNAIERFCRS